MKRTPEELLKLYEPKEQATLTPTRQLLIARFSPCGKLLLAGGFDGRVHRWDIEAEEQPELPPVAGHGGWVQGLAFAPGGEVVYTADSWGQLRCWPYADEKPDPRWIVEDAHDGWIQCLAVSADGKLLATCGNDRAARVWSAADGSKLHEFPHDEDLFSVALHADGKSLVTGDARGVVRHWDLATGEMKRELDAKKLYTLHRLQDVGGARFLAFQEDGAALLCAGTVPNNGATVQGIPTVLLFDWASGNVKHELTLGEKSECYVHEAQLYHDARGDAFLMAVTSGTPGRGKLLFQVPGEEKPFYTSKKMQNCHSLALHPDGRRLAVAATSRGSNGNGRRLNKDGEYEGNHSPVYLMTLPAEEAEAAE